MTPAPAAAVRNIKNAVADSPWKKIFTYDKIWSMIIHHKENAWIRTSKLWNVSERDAFSHI